MCIKCLKLLYLKLSFFLLNSLGAYFFIIWNRLEIMNTTSTILDHWKMKDHRPSILTVVADKF